GGVDRVVAVLAVDDDVARRAEAAQDRAVERDLDAALAVLQLDGVVAGGAAHHESRRRAVGGVGEELGGGDGNRGCRRGAGAAVLVAGCSGHGVDADVGVGVADGHPAAVVGGGGHGLGGRAVAPVNRVREAGGAVGGGWVAGREG